MIIYACKIFIYEIRGHCTHHYKKSDLYGHYFSWGQKNLQLKHIFSFIFIELQLQVTL